MSTNTYTNPYYNPNSELCLEVRQWLLDNPTNDPEAVEDYYNKQFDVTGLRWNHSEKTKKKMSQDRMGHKGVVHTEKSKKKMSKSHMGKVLSEETKKKMSQPRTEEHKKNIGKGMRQVWIKRKSQSL